MSGISRLLAKELSAALGITDNPKFNPMFKQTDEVISDVADPDDPTVARFYSPLESAIENAPIGKEGTRGENVEAFVRKRAPKVSKAEMEFRGLGLEPGELYTAESATEGLSGLNVKAVKKRENYNIQRQKNMVDEEIDYVELSLEADEELNYPAIFHYGSSNIAHTRYSVRKPSLLEESGNSLFSRDAINMAKRQNDKSRDILVYMPINDFLKAAKSIGGDSLKASQSKLKNTMDLLESNTPFSSIPSLIFKNKGDGTGKVVGHEGRHRAMAINALGLNERGVSQIPVILRSEAGEGPSIRWGQQSNPDSFDYVDKLPTKLISEEGSDTIPIPDHAKPEILRGENKEYILVEELQSDALQNAKENVDKIKTDLVKDYKPKFDSAIDDIAFKSEFDNPGNFFDEFEDFVFNKFIPIRTNSKISDKEAVNQLRTIFNDIGVDESEVPDRTLLSPRALKVYFETLAENKLNVYDFPGKDNILGLITDEVFDVIAESRKVVAKKDVPVSSITDTVRLALQAIISDAKSKGIDHIVLPPVERLAKERGVSTAKGSAFYNTYVAAYKKVMKQLEAELGKQVKVGKRDIVYKDLAHPDYDLSDPKYKTEQGTLLDISNLTLDPTTTKLRFNKGGLVERPER